MQIDEHVTAPRPTIPGVANLRDLGGLPASGGRIVVPGRLFRSSHLCALSDEEARRLGLRTVVDLRGTQERAAAPARGLAPSVMQVHLPIEPRAVSRVQELAASGDLDEAAVEQIMHAVYRRFVRDHTAVFGALLQRLLEPAVYPLLFHCTAGKDRTGFAAAVVLLALDVPPDVIERDFLLSNACWQPHRTDAGWVTLSRVRAAYLHTALDAMREDWGSVDAYLARGLGLDDRARGALQSALLTSPRAAFRAA